MRHIFYDSSNNLVCAFECEGRFFEGDIITHQKIGSKLIKFQITECLFSNVETRLHTSFKWEYYIHYLEIM